MSPELNDPALIESRAIIIQQAAIDARGSTNAEAQAAMNQAWSTITGVDNSTFTLTAAQASRVFDELAEPFENQAGNRISNRADMSGDNYSFERMTLFSLEYNSTTNDHLIGTNLRNAIANNNRFDAWYEIRYRSNGNNPNDEGAIDWGVPKRRYMESELFGLFNSNNPDNAEAEGVVNSFLENISVIEIYENTWEYDVTRNRNIIELANADYMTSINLIRTLPGKANFSVSNVGEILKPIKQYIIDRFVPDDGTDYGVEADSLTGEIILGIRNHNGIIAARGYASDENGADLLVNPIDRSSDLRGGAENDVLIGNDDVDTLRGEDGDDILIGKGGDDILIGGEGANQLYGGKGDDTYIISGQDSIIDSDRDGYIYFMNPPTHAAPN